MCNKNQEDEKKQQRKQETRNEVADKMFARTKGGVVVPGTVRAVATRHFRMKTVSVSKNADILSWELLHVTIYG